MSKIDDIINNPSPEPPENEDIESEEKDTEDLESEAKEKKEEKKEDDGPGVVKKLMKAVGLGKTKDEPGESDDDEDEEDEDIPDEFTEAAVSSGWQESDIVNFASDYSNEELKEMIPFLSADEKPEPEKKTQEKKEPEKDSESEKKDESEAIKALREEFRKEVDDLKKARKKDDDIQEAKAQEALVETVNKAFDEANEKFGVFGKTDELPKFPAGPKKGQLVPTSPAVKARYEVCVIAGKLIDAGTPAEEAMADALTWYKGKHLDKEVEKKYIKKLKDGEKKLSAKRQGKETQKTYEHEEDRGADVVRDLARKAGVKGELDE